MHLIALTGHHGVGKTTYANELVAELSPSAKIIRLSFADTPRKSVGKRFDIDPKILATNQKDTTFYHRDLMSPEEREILLRDGEEQISYRQLMIRWTNWEKQSADDPLIYLRMFKSELDEFVVLDYDFCVVDDLRLFTEYDFTTRYSHEVRLLTREDVVPPMFEDLDSFDKEMVRLIEQHGHLFNHVDVTRR